MGGRVVGAEEGRGTPRGESGGGSARAVWASAEGGERATGCARTAKAAAQPGVGVGARGGTETAGRGRRERASPWGARKRVVAGAAAVQMEVVWCAQGGGGVGARPPLPSPARAPPTAIARGHAVVPADWTTGCGRAARVARPRTREGGRAGAGERATRARAGHPPLPLPPRAPLAPPRASPRGPPVRATTSALPISRSVGRRVVPPASGTWRRRRGRHEGGRRRWDACDAMRRPSTPARALSTPPPSRDGLRGVNGRH